MQASLTALAKLIGVVAQLRSPVGGCPWDLAQTPQSLTPYILEEAYETVDAIQQGDPQTIAEELGDLLLQVVLQAQIASEYGQFSLTEVAEGIADKLIRRHPHVFGDVQVESAQAVRSNWEKIKQTEKQESFSEKLTRYGRSLPPLLAAIKISQKLADIGFDWTEEQEIWAKFQEEVTEFQMETDPHLKVIEFGDMLFSLLQIARWHGIDPSQALSATNRKFIERFRYIEQMSDRPLEDYSLAELESLWQKAKQSS